MIRIAAVVASFVALAASAQSLQVTTIAGSTTGGGYVDAAGAAARFSFPHAVAVDSAGNAFVSDSGNHVIRRIAPGGEVTTFAGAAGVSGSADGVRTAARFHRPAGLALDAATGVLYVADAGNHTIRAITPDGVVSTFAGAAGVAGRVAGRGAAARFSSPFGVTVDATGVLWVADTNNHCIRRIDSSGDATFYVGLTPGGNDGPANSALFLFPTDVAVDAAGNLYVADSGNHAIRKVDSSRLTYTYAGALGSTNYTPQDGVGTAAYFEDPTAVELGPDGSLYVADSNNWAIRRVTPTSVTRGTVTTIAGNGTRGSADGIGASARFGFPTGLAFGPDGRLYIADQRGFSIRRMTMSTAEVTTLAGSPPAPSSLASLTLGAAADAAGNVYVTDGNAVRRVAANGSITTIAGAVDVLGSADGTGAAARFRGPAGIVIEPSGNLLVADAGNSTIRRVTLGGVVTTVAGVAGSGGFANGTGSTARFAQPWGLAIDGAGNVYVADPGNHRIRMMTSAGVVTTFAGSGKEGAADGTALAASFNYPRGVAVDAAGDVYVADSSNNTVRRIRGGVVTTLAGLAGTFEYADGIGSAARFAGPISIAAGRNGVVYVADLDNSVIRAISATGAVTTVAGRADSAGNVDGTGRAARLFYPAAVTTEPAGTRVIGDSHNYALKRAVVVPGKRRPAKHGSP
jgi:sugar lactone lactonase YvrE